MDQQEPTIELDENTLIAQRKQKLQELRQKGNAFPNDFRRDALANDLHQKYEHLDHESIRSTTNTCQSCGTNYDATCDG